MRDPARTREGLLETAIGLVWQSNYCSVGVDEICRRAGVTKGAFYHHFSSKADLFYAAALHEKSRTQPELDAIFSPSLDPLERLERLFDYILLDAHAEQAAPDGDGVAPEVSGCPFFTAGGMVPTEETLVRQAAIDMADYAVRYAASLVRALRDGGYLNGDPDPEQVGRMIFIFIQGLLVYGRAHNSRAAVEADLRDGMYRLLDLKAEHRHAAAPAQTELAAAV